MAVVVDASVLLSVALEEPAARLILTAFDDQISSGNSLHAPALVLYEFASVVARARREGRMSAESAAAATRGLDRMPFEIHILGESVSEAVELSERFGKRNAYDMFYLVLARELGAELWTQDAGLRSQAAELGVPAVSFPSG